MYRLRAEAKRQSIILSSRSWVCLPLGNPHFSLLRPCQSMTLRELEQLILSLQINVSEWANTDSSDSEN